MLFNSYIFIFLFLPIVLIGYFLLGHYKYNYVKIFLVLMSLWFYSYTNISYLFLIITSVVCNYAGSFLIKHFDLRKKRLASKCVGFITILFNLGLLFYYKYYDFFASNCNYFFKTDIKILHIALPLGISFFTFQQISFICDRINGKSEHYSFFEYMAFVTYFPQLVAGPIVKHNELIPQFNNKKNASFNADNFAKGLSLTIIGIAKKVIIADSLSLGVNYGYDNISSLDTLAAIVVMLMYTMQIFFDFSGYCDIAVGIGKMMNIDLPINFNSPYKSKSVKEFWNRWHITLNKFFTEYVYIPLGGSRKGLGKTIINVLIVFILSGLWHGAEWTFIIWGLLHGIMVAIDRSVKVDRNNLFSWFLTFLFINLSWILFRSDNIEQAFSIYKVLITPSWNGAVFDIACSMDRGILYLPISFIKHFNSKFYIVGYSGYLILLLGISIYACTRKSSITIVNEMKYSKLTAFALVITFVLSTTYFTAVSSFLYSNF